jgi:hypothetical protein
MSAIGWITAARRFAFASVFRRSRPRKTAGRKHTPGLESLEKIDLMSSGLMGLSSVVALGVPVSTTTYRITGTSAIQSTSIQSASVQTVTVPNTLTNFTASFNPAITLFDPNLGTLTAVHVTVQATLTSQIKSQNTSSSSPATITPFITGDYTVSGLSQGIANNLNLVNPTGIPVQANTGDPSFQGNSTAAWTTPPTPGVPTSNQAPAVSATDTKTFTLTAPGDLAFYTAGVGRTTVTPQLTEHGTSGATAPNGNLQTEVLTSGSGVITISYDFCPTVVKLVRFGIHHQQTQLQLTFTGPIVPASDASNPANYKVIVPNKYGSFTGPGVTHVPVTSAVYNQANNTVTLTTARRLNVHHLFELEVNLPCYNGKPVIIEFGGKRSLGGFTNPHAGNVFVPVANGNIVR